MTPKEKAVKLIEDVRFRLPFIIDDENARQRVGKDIAILLVDEIIPCTWKGSTYRKENKYVIPELTTEYWLSVKEEINKQ